MQVIEKLHLSTISADKIVTGENIGQAYALTASGAADIGFIAASALPATGTAWPVPQNLHDPILQDAILLAHGADNQAARAFLDWLHSDPARTIIHSHGYEAGE